MNPEELTPEQREAVQRLLHLHYIKGVVDAAKNLSDTFAELGASTEVAVEALTQLLEWAQNETKEQEEVASE